MSLLGGSRARFPLRPSHFKDMSVISGASDAIFESISNDPYCRLLPYGRQALSDLPLARYRIIASIVSVDEAIASPALYLNLGQGYQEVAGLKIPLRKVRSNLYEAEFQIEGSLKSLRLDPSTRQGLFALGPIWLQRAHDGWEPGFMARMGHRLAVPLLNAVLPASLSGSVRKLNLLSRIVPLDLTAESFAADIVPRRDLAPASRALGKIANLQAQRPNYHHLYEVWRRMATGERSKNYGARTAIPVDASRCDIKPIAFYLPQFHPIPENDKWWGKGFTEWTNVSKACPQFVGHYQPRLPGEFGYYDLRLPEVMKEQAKLAKFYGLHGFCFHHYWFNGKRLLERPVDGLLADKSIDLNFCLCWANENWTRRWDGAEHEILMGQQHSSEDDLAFFADLARYLADPRYIKVDGKPLLVIYRPSLFPAPRETAERWRTEAVRLGYPGLYLVAANAFGFTDPASIGFDAIVEFPPHGKVSADIKSSLALYNPAYAGSVYRYEDIARDAHDVYPAEAVVIPGAMPSWDNEARRPGRGNVMQGSTPALFRDWLVRCFEHARRNVDHSCPFVFINAWNEWAEAAYLEPDRHLGYAYLAAIGNCMEQYSRIDPSIAVRVTQHNSGYRRRARSVCIVHLYYHDLLDEILTQCRGLREADLYISIPKFWSREQVEDALAKAPDARVFLCSNRGRDIWPFLTALSPAISAGYELVCKVHTKKSPHLPNGDSWRRSLVQDLLQPSKADEIVARFDADAKIGLIAPEHALMPLNEEATLLHNRAHIDAFLNAWKFSGELDFRFPAGSMFWARAEALKPLLDLRLDEESFEHELGQIDGTAAHAIERCFGACVVIAGYKVETLADSVGFNPYRAPARD